MVDKFGAVVAAVKFSCYSKRGGIQGVHDTEREVSVSPGVQWGGDTKGRRVRERKKGDGMKRRGELKEETGKGRKERREKEKKRESTWREEKEQGRKGREKAKKEMGRRTR